MFILYGTGANGKSTFLNVIQNILGNYALSTWAETFMKRNNDSATTAMARLRGARFVTISETEQGKRLSEHLIKQVTGNDALTARFLYGEYINFVPTFKIFMASNHIASRKLVIKEETGKTFQHNLVEPPGGTTRRTPPRKTWPVTGSECGPKVRCTGLGDEVCEA
jgi:hypothetical protein